MRNSELRANTYRLARAAIKYLEKDKTRAYWMQVGEGFLQARVEAKAECGLEGTNQITHRLGGAYNRAFGDILKRERLTSKIIDSATRNHLFTIMDNKPDVEAALALLDPEERAKLNHPSAILRYWKNSSAQQDGKHKKRAAAAKDTSTELGNALQRIDQLTAHVEELEAARPGGGENEPKNLDQLWGEIASTVEDLPADQAVELLVALRGFIATAEKAIRDKMGTSPKSKTLAVETEAMR